MEKSITDSDIPSAPKPLEHEAQGPKRNQAFKPEREPLRQLPTHQVRHSSITGPFSFLNPTRAHFQVQQSAAHEAKADAARGKDFTPGVNYKWTSRNNRKGRHALAVDSSVDASTVGYESPRSTSSSSAIARGILRMFTYYPVWDVSYLVAVIFTLGSVVWVFNAFFVYLPLQKPSTEFNNEILYGGGITAFVGATIFVIGSVFLMLEAVNENRTGCFGWAVEELEQSLEKQSQYRLRPSDELCVHHHTNKRNLVGKSDVHATADGVHDGGPVSKSWVWWPSWDEMRTHYIHELGFLACLSQLCGATIFWIAGFTALPGIFNHLSPGLTDGIYWTPQVVGGCGFIVSGTLFMVETQPKWYIPAPTVLGWHIGLWNLIGGVGFTLSPAFGYDTATWAQYQAALSTFWGSWAFLIGSVIQWYESLDKHPVQKEHLN